MCADSGEVADALAAASTHAEASVGSLGDSLNVCGPLASKLGYSFEDTTQALAMMSRAGIEGKDAGAALQTMMTNLSNPTSEVKSAMDQLGVSLKNSDGSMKTLDQVMADLRSGFKGLDEDQQAAYAATLFGEKAMSGAMAVVTASEDEYIKLGEAMNNSEGSAQTLAETMGDNLSGRVEEMKSALAEAGITIFESLQPALEKIVECITFMADAFSNLSPQAQMFIIILGGLIAIAGIVLPIISALVGIVTTLGITFSVALGWIVGIILALAAILTVLIYWEQIKEFFIAFWEVIKELFWISLNALKAFFIEVWNGISAVTSVVWEGIKEFLSVIWQGILSFVSPIFESIKTIIENVWNVISTVTSAVWGFITQYLQAIWTALIYILSPVFENIKIIIKNVWESVKTVSSTVWEWIKEKLTAVWNGLKALVSPIFDGIKNTISNVWNTIKSVSTSVWDGVKNSLTNTWNSIKSTASTLWNGLKTTISTPVDAIKDHVTSAFTGMKDTALGAWEGLKTGMKTVINGIIRMVNKFIDGFNTPAKLLNNIPKVNAPIIPNIPFLATGGHLFGSGAAIVGEAGPELLSKSGSSVKVTPLSASEKARGIRGSLGSGGVYEFHLSVPIDGRELAKSTVRYTAEELGRLRVRGAY
ncbi:phage tail tape measure protein [Bacillus carboniphilus]|uniref:Phage tail tape measure protein n=1 Tax=Bacillus carboniphilus TaxID=86663 RepID=A0ABY9JY68_9BACI|nr:phage tail tape measure protein [Bacillus carboniphilus]WLR44332.1 phage tail tape measure protein [Bacillus carboniphilus]